MFLNAGALVKELNCCDLAGMGADEDANGVAGAERSAVSSRSPSVKGNHNQETINGRKEQSYGNCAEQEPEDHHQMVGPAVPAPHGEIATVEAESNAYGRANG